MTTIIVSDGQPLEVRTLGIFELDPIMPPALTPFTYDMTVMSGEKVTVEFDYTKFKTPPERPDVDEADLVKGSRLWYKYRTWQFYEAAVSRERAQYQELDDYCDRVLDYILTCCIAPEDEHRLVTEEDLDKFEWAALVPQLGKETIAKVLRETYKAKFNDEELFEAMAKTAGGMGIYDAIRLWENKIANQLGLADAEYARIPLEERARRVVAMNMDGWMSHLTFEMERRRRPRHG